MSPATPPTMIVALTRRHHQRLRDVYRSSGWPCQDMLEVELLACGLLERRTTTPSGHESLRLTDAGLVQLAQAYASNKAARLAHEALVDKVCVEMGRAGRVVWRTLSLRAQTPMPPASTGDRSARVIIRETTRKMARELTREITWKRALDRAGDMSLGTPLDTKLDRAMDMTMDLALNRAWVIACPDVFSIRNTSVEAYLEPIVHEIKVNRADLLADLKKPNKRAAYLGLGGECWYVLGQTAKGQPIAQPDEIPPECGVMLLEGAHLIVARSAPRKPMERMPFHVWMALVKATPVARDANSDQAFF